MSNINVTRSSMPSFEEYCNEIKDLWESHWLTNMGIKHQQLQAAADEHDDESNKAQCGDDLRLLGRTGQCVCRKGCTDGGGSAQHVVYNVGDRKIKISVTAVRQKLDAPRVGAAADQCVGSVAQHKEKGKPEGACTGVLHKHRHDGGGQHDADKIVQMVGKQDPPPTGKMT